MQILRFGRPSRRLAGVFHEGDRHQSTTASVLICGPLGQESVRAHRTLRLLSEALARHGISTLRFDYFGTGDSSGDDAQCTLAGCSEDILTAHAELARRTLSNRIVWIGVRLGANAALNASSRAPWPPRSLVLWEPILDGTRHFSGLLQQHTAYVKRNGVIHDMPSTGITDLLGFAVGTTMKEEIESLDWTSVAATKPASVVLIAPTQDPKCDLISQLWRKASVPLSRLALDHGLDWNAEEAMNTALAPSLAVATIVKAVGDSLS